MPPSNLPERNAAQAAGTAFISLPSTVPQAGMGPVALQWAFER